MLPLNVTMTTALLPIAKLKEILSKRSLSNTEMKREQPLSVGKTGAEGN